MRTIDVKIESRGQNEIRAYQFHANIDLRCVTDGKTESTTTKLATYFSATQNKKRLTSPPYKKWTRFTGNEKQPPLSLLYRKSKKEANIESIRTRVTFGKSKLRP